MADGVYQVTLLRRSKFTYGQLDIVLKSFGFTCRPSTNDPPGRIYEHPQTGARISLPTYPLRNKVFEYHMVAVRGQLYYFGIADSDALEAKVQKAS
jgi:hypothetical protein